MLRHWGWASVYNYGGDALRGVIDKDVLTDLMLSLNLDFPFKVFLFRPSEWFNNKKLEFFNFDVHLSPVIDTALYNNTSTTDNFFENMLVSAGIEAIIYPYKFRSFYFRISFGRMIKGNIETGDFEIQLVGRLFY
jgi:hypothetical protein